MFQQMFFNWTDKVKSFK